MMNCVWQIDVIINLLRALRERYSLAVKSGDIHLLGQECQKTVLFFRDRELSSWFDATRS